MKRSRMRIVKCTNLVIPEVMIVKDNKVLGYASYTNFGMGGSEEVWDNTTKAEQAKIERRLRMIHTITRRGE